MKQDLPKYPKYKPSGVDWFSAIPTHWGLYFLGTTTSLIQTGPFGSQLHASEYVEDEIPIINPSNISNGRLVCNAKNTVPEKKADELSRHRVKLGDIIFGRRGEMGRCGLVTEAETGWICGTGSLLLRLKSHVLLPQYAIHLLSQTGIKEHLILESVGATMDNLNTRILSKLKIPVPPTEEQTSILAFLDRETAKIDRLMSVRRRQIEVLQEQRAAVIHHTVTKGLDPDAEMKPSGVEWLGEIPVHWDCLRLRRLSIIRRGASPRPIHDPKYFDDNGEYGWVRISDVTNSDKYLEGTTQILSELGASFSVKLQSGSLFLSICASVGKPIISRIPCCIHDGFVYFPELKHNSEYFYYIFKSGEPYKGLGNWGTQLNLNTDIK